MDENSKVITTLKKIVEKIRDNILCETCDKTFKTAKALLAHKNRFHSAKVDRFHCPECNIKPTTTSYGLQLHLEKSHYLVVDVDTIKDKYNKPRKNTKKCEKYLFLV